MNRALDAALRLAVEQGDAAQAARLYAQAAQEADNRGETEAAHFLRVAAFVYALEAGSSLAEGLSDSLAAEGRERPFRF